MTPDERLRRARELYALDRDLVERILAFGGSRDGWEPRAHFGMDLQSEPAGTDLYEAWAAYDFRDFDGRSMAAEFADAHGATLPIDGRAWLAAQEHAWLSGWAVLAVDPGASLTLHDVFTGEERTVIEEVSSHMLGVHDVVLCRIVDFEGMTLVRGSHPQALDPHDAQEFVEMLPRVLRMRGPWTPDAAEMRAPFMSTLLVEAWELVLDAMAARPPAPRLRRSDMRETRPTFDSGCAPAETELSSAAVAGGSRRGST